MYLQQQLAIHSNVIDVGTSCCLKCHCAVSFNMDCNHDRSCVCSYAIKKRSHTQYRPVIVLIMQLVVFYYIANKFLGDAISLWGPRPASWDQQFKQCYKN